MKKLYGLIVVALMAMLSFQAKAASYSMTLNIDTPSNVESLILYSDYNMTTVIKNFTPSATQTVDFDYANFLYIKAKSGSELTDFYNNTQSSSSNWPTNRESHTVYMTSSYNGQTCTIKTTGGGGGTTYSGSVTVQIKGSTSGLSISLAGATQTISSGTNSLSFSNSATANVSLEISYPSGTIYSVTKNGSTEASNQSSCTFYVATGDNVVITMEQPATVLFTFTNTGTEGYISYVSVEGNSVTVDQLKSGVQATPGSPIDITVASSGYTLNSFTIGGTPSTAFSSSTSYSGTVGSSGTTTVYNFDVNTSSAGSGATININDDPAKVRVLTQSGVMSLSSGLNNVEISGSSLSLMIYTQSSASDISSVVLNDVSRDPTYSDASGKYWSVTLEAGDRLVINTGGAATTNYNVSFGFTNDGTSNYVTSVSVDGVSKPGWASGLTVASGSSLSFTVASSGYTLNSFTINGSSSTALNSSTTYGCSVTSDLAFNFDVTPGAASSTATVVVNGNASYVNMMIGSTAQTLYTGTNTVTIEGASQTVSIEPASGKTIHSVLLNSVAVETSSADRWSFHVAPNDVVLINQTSPSTITVNISMILVDDDTAGCVSSVKLNGVTVANWSAGFTATKDDVLKIEFDTEAYDISSFTLNWNDAWTSVSNGVYTHVVGAVGETYRITANAATVETATVTVNRPAELIYYLNDYSSTPVEKKPSATQFTVNCRSSKASYSRLYFKLADPTHYIITSVVVDGVKMTEEKIDGSIQYGTQFTNGMQVEIDIEKLNPENTSYFYFHNPDDAGSGDFDSILGYLLKNKSTQSASEYIPLHQGYNKLTYDTNETPYRFNILGDMGTNESLVWLYVNGVLTMKTEEHNLGWQMNLVDRDVVKVYYSTTRPPEYTMTYELDNNLLEVDKSVKFISTYDYLRTPTFTPTGGAASTRSRVAGTYTVQTTENTLPGTVVTIQKRASDPYMWVQVYDDNTKEKIGDATYTSTGTDTGYYTFTPTRDTRVKMTSLVTLGLQGIDVDGLPVQDSRIFNMQGIEMRGDNLPAGIYIQNGRKIIVR